MKTNSKIIVSSLVSLLVGAVLTFDGIYPHAKRKTFCFRGKKIMN